MAWTKTFLDFFRGIAWPIGIAAAAYFLRDHLGGVLKRAESIEVPGVGKVTLAAQVGGAGTDAGRAVVEELLEDGADGPGAAEDSTAAEDVDEDFAAAISDLATRLDGVEEERRVVDAELRFERIYNRIFGSQILLLDSLVKAPMFSREQLQTWYEGLVKSIPELAPISFHDYMTFLVSWELVSAEFPDRYRATELANAFLRYIDASGYPRAKPF